MSPKLAVADKTVPPVVPWWQRANNTQVFCTAIIFALVVAGVLAGTDILSIFKGPFISLALVINCVVGAVCGALLVKIMRDSRDRYSSLVQRLQIIADMNHHIRNALEQIEMSAHTTHDQELIRNIQMSVSRIQWALREVLPQDIDNGNHP